MKRFISTIMVLILSLSIFAACQNTQNSFDLQNNVLMSAFDVKLSAEVMEQKLEQFLNIGEKHPDGDLGVREPFSEKELAVAERLISYGESFRDENGEKQFDVSKQNFTVSSKQSQNIIIKKNGTSGDGKQVIIGANYDNIVNLSMTSYPAAEIVSDITKSLGAMENGTGCALLMALIDYYSDKTLSFDLVFVFFGAGTMIGGGSDKFVDKMNNPEKDNTLLMINLKRFGGDNIYLYSEEVKTKHNKYLIDISDTLDLAIKPVPKNVSVISAVAVERIPYTHWAMVGGHSPFMNEHINVANIFSGNLGTLAVIDLESSSYNNRTYTIDDTYQNLKKDLPEYKNQMAVVAELITTTLSKEDFAAVMAASRSEFRNYDAWTNEFVAMLVLIGLILAVTFAIFFVSKHFEKKYPFVPQKLPNLKVAVFGTDYEDKNSKDIIIDLKKPEDPFGI